MAKRARCVGSLPRFLRLSKYGLGVALILCVAVIWVASSVWIQFIFGELSFQKPFFLTYFNTSGFFLWNCIFLCSPQWRRISFDEQSSSQPLCLEDLRLQNENDPYFQVDYEKRYMTAPGNVDSESFVPPSPYRGTEQNDEQDGGESVHTAMRDPGGVSHQSESGRPHPSHSSNHSAFSEVADEEGALQEKVAGGKSYTYSTRKPEPCNPIRDECRDYSLSTSFVSSNQEEVVVFPPGRDDEDLWDGAGKDNSKDSPRVASHQLSCARKNRVRPYSLRRIWTCAFLFCPLWFLANYLFNLSLAYTKVSSNTILSSTSSIWTLLMSYVLLKESVGPHCWLAIGLSIGGSILVALKDADTSGTDTVGGDLAALTSAFCYAAYTSVLKLWVPDDRRFSMAMVFGAVGAINIVFLWPFFPILNATGVEPFTFPTWTQLGSLAVNALIGTNLSDVLWARSIILTSPVVATLGLSLSTPLSMIYDGAFKGVSFTPQYIAGASMVLFGFILANTPLSFIKRVCTCSWKSKKSGSHAER